MQRWDNPPIEVKDEEWLSQQEAAERLGLFSTLSVGLRIAEGSLQAATSERFGPGVTRSSVERELQWRRSASFPKRMWKALRRVLRWISP